MKRKLHTRVWIQKQNVFILLFFLFSLLGFSQEANHIRGLGGEWGGAYNKGDYWDAKIVGSNLYITALIADDECQAGDNYIQTLEVELAGKRLFRLQQSSSGTDYRLTEADNICINPEQLRWNIIRDYPFSYDKLAYEGGNNGVLYFTIPLRAEFLVGPVTLSVTAKHFDDYNNTAPFTTTILPTMPDLRITQGCGAVKLAWNKVTPPTALTASDFKFVVKKDGVAVASSLGINELGYTVTGVAGTVSTTVDLMWKTEIIDSKSIDGSSYDPLSIPAELTASTNRCDGTVELKWQWSQSSPTSFVVYRSENASTGFTLVSNTILGTKRSYIVTGLTRGKEYYFKIAAKGGKCPEEGLSSADDVVGISPTDPLEPMNAKMSLLTGNDSGVNLTWNETRWLGVDFQNATDQK